MTWRTSLFLVLLQLAIGVHLLYEGCWKVQNPAWTSEGYLRGSAGPASLPMRWLAGDPDVTWQGDCFGVADSTADFVAHFAVPPAKSGNPVADSPAAGRFPVPLDKEWTAYFDAFVKNYKLDGPDDTPVDGAKGIFLVVLGATPESGFPPVVALTPSYFSAAQAPDQSTDHRLQKILAELKFLQAKSDTLKWLTDGVKKTTPTWFTGEVPLKTPERVQDYLKKVEQIRDLETKDLAIFGSKVTAKLTKARDEAKTMKKELQDDLDDRTAQMKKALREVLTYEQKRMAPVSEDAKPKATWSQLTRIDNAVRWGLVAAGAGLILGLFTRLACLAGAVLLLLFYLAAPPWPGIGDATASKGHYLFVNENIIEILALMVIATSRPWTRYGLDAWLPFRRRDHRPNYADQPATRGRNLQTRRLLDNDQ
jgi:uncharacterized membrane protein YphA (DoxX/SURF4 family)